MVQDYKFTVTEKFLQYVQIDTQSDPESNTSPSTAKQKNLSIVLANQLIQMGAKDVYTDQFGYVYATIPSNASKKVPVVCFCSHIDTAPDCSGTDVKPIVHHNYNGEPIILPDDSSQIITIDQYPYLKNHIGNSIITASGKTLLGADDKSGVAIIMDMANFLLTHPEIIHGTIKILFTPDEEVGAGTAKLDLQRLKADVAYTLDGGEIGTMEDETFSADGVTIIIKGIIAHPGNGKGKLVNAIKIISEIINTLPKHEKSPETTEKREGFIHPIDIQGLAEEASAKFLIRDFETENLLVLENLLKQIATDVVRKYPGAEMEFIVTEQYRNMKEVLQHHPHIVAYAEEAYKRIGLNVVKEPIRGGTDGSRLSFMGLPCPNLFTGMQAIHSKHEWIGVKDMEKAVEMLVTLVQVWEEKSV